MATRGSLALNGGSAVIFAVFMGTAHASDDALTDARAAQRKGLPDAEAAACAQVVQAAESPRGVAACTKRLDWLDARRDEDDRWTGLTALLAVRRLPPPQRHDALATLSERPGLSPLLRREVRTALARQRLDGEQDPEGALRITTPLWASADALDPAERRAIADLHARALFATGHEDEANAVERSAGMLRSGLPHEGLPLKQQQRRQARLDRLAAGTLGGWLLFALPLGTAGWLRAPRPRPLGLVPLAVTAAGAGVLLALRDPSLLPALVGFFAGAATIHLLSAGAHLRLVDRPWLQRGLAVGALLATVALGGLTLGQ